MVILHVYVSLPVGSVSSIVPHGADDSLADRLHPGQDHGRCARCSGAAEAEGRMALTMKEWWFDMGLTLKREGLMGFDGEFMGNQQLEFIL